MSIKFQADENTKMIVNAYDDSKPDGLHNAQMVQELAVIDNLTGFGKTVTRKFRLKGTKEFLEMIVKSYEKRPVEGNLVWTEYLESQVPNELLAKLVTGSKTYEEAIAYNIKRAGKDGPELTNNGERILFFISWDRSGLLRDTVVPHDNKDEVRDYVAVRDSQAVLEKTNG